MGDGLHNKDNETLDKHFSSLALGARFNYLGGNDVWVKIGTNVIALWVEDMKDCCWIGQRVCCFSDTDDLNEAVDVL